MRAFPDLICRPIHVLSRTIDARCSGWLAPEFSPSIGGFSCFDPACTELKRLSQSTARKKGVRVATRRPPRRSWAARGIVGRVVSSTPHGRTSAISLSGRARQFIR